MIVIYCCFAGSLRRLRRRVDRNEKRRSRSSKERDPLLPTSEKPKKK